MTIYEFLKSQLDKRISAAVVLSADLRINDISIGSGYNADKGIEVKEGLEKIADMYKVEIMQESKPGITIDTHIRYITVSGVRLYTESYSSRKENSEDVQML